MRRRISLRHLLLAATTVAVALSVVLADKNAHPMATSASGYLTALNVAFEITISFGFWRCHCSRYSVVVGDEDLPLDCMQRCWSSCLC